MSAGPKQLGPLEVWGGLEGTVNRVRDRYFDQSERNGHYARPDDLERFAALGIKAIRYPVLWEKVAPEGLARADWRLADARLPRLRELGVRPIAGLCHHGSGPRDTSLVDPAFPEKLAVYARAVAERFPWVEEWTPVNEPLTTARFSALYGHWYPHARDTASFARAQLGQCKAVVLAMREIRKVNPRARLVQTDDIGHTVSTPLLAYQRDFENERRWLTFDLLCGRVTREHPFWAHLTKWGASEADLEFFLEHPTPPDVVGLNYYLTSDRLLDERMERYPEWSHGGNDRHRYTDIESVRAWAGGIPGHEALLQKGWDRYGLPVAFTEVHLGCTREEQLRWLKEAWDAARAVRARGGDVRAITVWSLLGAFDWNTLVTQEKGFYEPGVFDVRGPAPRRTAIGNMVEALARTGDYQHPVLESIGWWRRDDRFFYPLVGDKVPQPPPPGPEQPLLVVGATGTLGKAFARLCKLRGLAHRLLGRADMDIGDAASVAAALERHKPWAVVNAAGYVRVDDAEADAERCMRENAAGPALLAAACAERGIRLLTFSSDLVFDGRSRERPYLEGTPTSPLNVYGRSKVEAEKAVLERLPGALVVRTGAFFGPWDVHNFVHHALQALSRGETFRAAEDQVVSPTYVPDLVHTSLDLFLDGVEGVLHLTNRGEVSWAELARLAAKLAGMSEAGVEGVPTSALGLPARRPHYSALASERCPGMPTLEDALARYITEREVVPVPASAPAVKAREKAERTVQGGGRTTCSVCGGAADEGHGDGRCGLHRERGERGAPEGGP